MLRLIGAVMVVIFFSPPFNSTHEGSAKYKTIEAYEVRPGILMMPGYSADGKVCEIGLEDLHYSPGLVRLESNLSGTVIHQIFDELVPGDERGPKSKGFDGLITGSGHDMTEITDFERVSLQIYREVISKTKKGGLTVGHPIAVIQWKNRECQKP
jgi:hypothetical protein